MIRGGDRLSIERSGTNRRWRRGRARTGSVVTRPAVRAVVGPTSAVKSHRTLNILVMLLTARSSLRHRAMPAVGHRGDADRTRPGKLRDPPDSERVRTPLLVWSVRGT